MTKNTIITINGGSAQYWRERKRAFGLIRQAESAARHHQTAPVYIAGEWDDDYGDYAPVENLAPFEAMADAIHCIEADRIAISILRAQGRTHIGTHEIKSLSVGRLAEDDHIGEPG